jgi:plasmid stabilization system protein ParE
VDNIFVIRIEAFCGKRSNENPRWAGNTGTSGKNYSLVSENLLGYKAGRHIVFYRKNEENPVEITRILLEQMDLKD